MTYFFSLVCILAHLAYIAFTYFAISARFEAAFIEEWMFAN